MWILPVVAPDAAPTSVADEEDILDALAEEPLADDFAAAESGAAVAVGVEAAVSSTLESESFIATPFNDAGEAVSTDPEGDVED